MKELVRCFSLTDNVIILHRPLSKMTNKKHDPLNFVQQTCCWQKIELLLQYSADLQLSTTSHPTVLAWMKERIGLDFAAQLEKLHDAIARGQTPERPEHGYLFQDGGLEND